MGRARARSQELMTPSRAIKPDAHGAGTVNGSGIDMKGFRSALFFIDVGTIGSAVDVKLQESSDDGDTDAFSDISGGAITQITGSDKNAVISVNSEQTERFIRAVLVAGGTEDVQVTCIRSNREETPNPEDSTVYDEVVNVHPTP